MQFFKMTGMVVAAFVMSASFSSGRAQGVAVAPAPWNTGRVVYAAGLPDVKPNSQGSLALTATGVDFATIGVRGTIPFERITAVSIGDERVATGGAGGKVARAIPFFGFGAAMGAITNKKVDLLTIEYRDKDGGQHGAVFEVPKLQAAAAQMQLASLVPPARTVTASQTCSGTGAPYAILVAPIALSEIDLPAEYRVLLYEQLVTALEASNGAGSVYRAGDGAVPCGAKTLLLSVTAFKKGNEAVRASTGPVGLFVGGTSVKFHVSLTDSSGTVRFEKSLKTNKRGDGDSLNVTRDLAKSVSKRLAKAEKASAQHAS